MVASISMSDGSNTIGRAEDTSVDKSHWCIVGEEGKLLGKSNRELDPEAFTFYQWSLNLQSLFRHWFPLTRSHTAVITQPAPLTCSSRPTWNSYTSVVLTKVYWMVCYHIRHRIVLWHDTFCQDYGFLIRFYTFISFISYPVWTHDFTLSCPCSRYLMFLLLFHCIHVVFPLSLSYPKLFSYTDSHL